MLLKCRQLLHYVLIQKIMLWNGMMCNHNIMYISHRYDQGFIMWIQCGIFICATCFHAIAEPYKTPYMNNADILILSFLCSLSCTGPGIVRFLHLSHGSTFKSLSIISLSVPHVALMFYTCFKLAEKTGITRCLKIKWLRIASKV